MSPTQVTLSSLMCLHLLCVHYCKEKTKKKQQAGPNFKVNNQHESGNEKRLFGHFDFNHQIQKPLPSVTQACSSRLLPSQPMLLDLETKLLHLFVLKKKSDLSWTSPRLIHMLTLQFLADVFTSWWKIPYRSSPRFGFLLVFYPLILVAYCGIADNTRKSCFTPITGTFFKEC